MKFNHEESFTLCGVCHWLFNVGTYHYETIHVLVGKYLLV